MVIEREISWHPFPYIYPLSSVRVEAFKQRLWQTIYTYILWILWVCNTFIKSITIKENTATFPDVQPVKAVDLANWSSAKTYQNHQSV